MLQSILNSMFGCSHQRTTFPMTPLRKSNGTYVACLDCGKEFTYDWKTMRVGGPVSAPERIAVPASVSLAKTDRRASSIVGQART